MSFQSSASSVSRPSFRKSGATVANDVYPGTKHNSASVLLEKMERVPVCFGTKKSKFCFKIISFSSLESELSFESGDSE